MSLSSVGYNAKKDQALVFVGNSAGPTNGGTFYILLTKVDEKWTIKSIANISAS